MTYKIEEVLAEIDNTNDNSYLEILEIERQIKILEKASKCMKIAVNSRKEDVNQEILAIIG